MKKIICFLFVLIVIITTKSIVSFAAIEQPIPFLQYDEQWSSKPYSIINDSSQTIETSGCGPTTMAMVLNYYIDEDITPVETAEFAIENHHRTTNNGTSWTYFNDVAEEYDLNFLQTYSSEEALKWMETKTDPLIICSMGPGLWTNKGHFILIWDIKDGNAYINDPNSESEKRNKNSFNYLSKQCNQYFCFDRNTKIIFQNYLCCYFEKLNLFLLNENINKVSPMIIT